MAGLTPTGFTSKSLDEIREEIKTELRARVSSQLNLEADSSLGEVVAIISEAAALIWEELAALYGSTFPDGATGRALDNIAALTGTVRRGATAARAAFEVNVNPGTYVAGSLQIIPQGDPTAVLVNLEDIVNGGGAAADIAGIWEATAAGATGWSTSTVFVIGATVGGWNAVANGGLPSEVTNGLDAEKDAELRARRAQELAASGSTTVDAIRADILRNVVGVISATVVENDTSAVDADGRPPHSVEAIVLGPVPPTAADDQALADQIFATKAGGIEAFGTQTETVTDSQGNGHTIGFSRPVAVPVKAGLLLTLDGSGDYPGDADAKELLAAAANAAAEVGEDQFFTRFLCYAFDIPGVLNAAPTAFHPAAGPPTVADISIGAREIATYDVADITLAIV
jgi:uncharacterized phage protein gp47/JayE